MKIAVIYGSMHKGSTYNCVKIILNKLQDKDTEIEEYFLPKDMPYFCCSCFSCFLKGEETCPHFNEMSPIVKSMDDADLIILSSPVYVCDVSGQMKAFLDHLAYRWMPHRPSEAMFHKVGLVVSTAAGAGTRATNKTMKKTFTYCGISKIYSFGANVAAMSFEDINIKKKNKIEKKLDKLANKIKKAVKVSNKRSPGMFVKIIFNLMKLSHKNNNWNKTDYNYWKNKGWLNEKKPW